MLHPKPSGSIRCSRKWRSGYGKFGMKMLWKSVWDSSNSSSPQLYLAQALKLSDHASSHHNDDILLIRLTKFKPSAKTFLQEVVKVFVEVC